MEYRRLGRSGLKLSALSLGTWITFSNQVDVSKAIDLFKIAYDAGVNFFDNAEEYADGESERIMGKALKKLSFARDSYCVSSKVFWGGKLPTQRGLSRKHVFDACHAALERLQVDYLDLFFCHRPDYDTPIEETVWAMNLLIQQGKVLYWGTSEWSADQIMQAYAVAKEQHLIPPAMEQPQYNMFERNKLEHDYLQLFSDIGLGTTIWSPLASGFLTGKYQQGIPKDSRATLPRYDWLKQRIESEQGKAKIAKVQSLLQLAKQLGIPLTQMALAWCLKNPNVSTVILGASRVEQLQENLNALDAVTLLSTDVMQHIDEILKNKPEEIRRY